jgi:phosphoribosylamine--glycine ligase
VKALIIGGGGREHALGWAIKKSDKLKTLFTAPGNGGTASCGENVSIDAKDIDGLAAFARTHSVDLTIVGPEAPLVDGIVDRFEGLGLLCFGPSRNAARLEGSKVFAKEFMKRHGIPTADFEIFRDAEGAKRYLTGKNPPLVVKADGLAAGKGVIVAQSKKEAETAIDEIMTQRKFGESGDKIVIESCLVGEEVSIHAICSGEKALLLPPSQDHKQIYDGDRGPNTGGMGAYAPVPHLDDSIEVEIRRSIIEPTLRGMKSEGYPFKGLLYAGLMLTEQGPKVLEYNVRFGDPETQVLMPLIKDDLFQVLCLAAKDQPPESLSIYRDRTVATVVAAAEGYPGHYEKGFEIEGLSSVGMANRVVFHAGTARKGGRMLTSGGRVFAMTAWAPDLQGALHLAYGGLDQTHFTGAYWRRDIGHRAIRKSI